MPEIDCATARASTVFAVPGTSSKRTCPSHASAASTSLTSSVLPWTTVSTFSRRRSAICTARVSRSMSAAGRTGTDRIDDPLSPIVRDALAGRGAAARRFPRPGWGPIHPPPGDDGTGAAVTPVTPKRAEFVTFGERRPLRTDASDVEANVQHVAVADDVGLALQPLERALRRLRVRAGLDEVLPVDHLAADEPARDVGVDRLGGIERRLPVAERPRARLLLAGREEGDQVERVAEARRDLVERRRAAVTEGRSVLVVHFGQLRLELQIDSARAVLDREQRLRRQRFELGRELAVEGGEHGAGVDVREDLPQLVDLDPQLRVAGLRLLLDALEP